MIVHNINGYKVMGYNDEYGRDQYLIGYFKEQEHADLAAKGRGWYGSDGIVTKVTDNIIVFDSLQEYNDNKVAEKAAQVMQEIDKLDTEVIEYIKRQMATREI